MAFVAWRRGPRGAVDAGQRVAAASAGWPRGSGSGRGPTQTVYEYATALGDVLPDIRPELQTVATREGRGGLRPAATSATTGSGRCATRTRRLRVGLLRLALPTAAQRRARRRERRRLA